jgi:hypothetical protein
MFRILFYSLVCFRPKVVVCVCLPGNLIVSKRQCSEVDGTRTAVWFCLLAAFLRVAYGLAEAKEKLARYVTGCFIAGSELTADPGFRGSAGEGCLPKRIKSANRIARCVCKSPSQK